MKLLWLDFKEQNKLTNIIFITSLVTIIIFVTILYILSLRFTSTIGNLMKNENLNVEVVTNEHSTDLNEYLSTNDK